MPCGGSATRWWSAIQAGSGASILNAADTIPYNLRARARKKLEPAASSWPKTWRRNNIPVALILMAEVNKSRIPFCLDVFFVLKGASSGRAVDISSSIQQRKWPSDQLLSVHRRNLQYKESYMMTISARFCARKKCCHVFRHRAALEPTVSAQECLLAR